MIRDNGVQSRGRMQTPRFLWPAAGMMAAMLILIAGAFDDVPSWWHGWPPTITPVTGGVPAIVDTVERPQPETAPAPDDALLRQRDHDLRARIAEETQDLSDLRAAAEQARRDLDAVRERPAHEPVVASQTAIDDIPPPRVVASMTDDRASAASAARSGAATSAPEAAKPDEAGYLATASHVAPAPGSATAPEQRDATRRLTLARAALAVGRRARARWLLSLVRSHLTPETEAGTPFADQIDDAISFIERGDREAALQTIDQLLAAVSRPDAGHPTVAEFQYNGVR
jgi:hypothetical protein